ncbi:AAA family ATPase [Nocardiopsis ansamitocini]|uniref:ATP-binding protein n=1 Tax=Nocardiopsis ansamitocini TaxID=1670832 RepID=A0A9W6P2S1_9ACTN|nr:AAA family ATPase [Nocardiopsis ansamitocini]GLU46170.1 ATP-binding protein [Nocardiopsis ansamitocini]
MNTIRVSTHPLPAKPPKSHTLRYPRRSLVLLGGIPGAGKSTLINRLYGLTGTETSTVRTSDGVWIVDSLQSRNRLTPILRGVPYPSWRWVVHVLHYVRVVAALRGGGPVIVHEAATRGIIRRLIGLCCRAAGVQMHVLLIDADPREARQGQITRGRVITARSFRTHERRWRALIDACAGASTLPGSHSVVVLNRVRASGLRRIVFGARPAAGRSSYGPAARVLTCPQVYSSAALLTTL